MKTKTYFIIALIFSLSLVVITQQACKKEEEPDPPNNEELSIPETTKVIDQNIWNSNFVSLDSSNYTITFKEELTKETPISVGDIVVSQDGYGYLRKVTSIQEDGNNIKVYTSFVSLSEAIENGSFSFETVLSEQRIMKINYLKEGVLLDTSNIRSTEETALNYNLDTYLDNDKKVHLTGSFVLLPSLNAELIIDWFEVKKLRVEFVVDEQINIESTLELLNIAYDKEIELAQVTFNPIIAMIGPVPVIIVPELEIMAGANFNVESTVTTSVNQSMSYIAGLLYENSKWSLYKELNKQLNYLPPTLTATAEAKAYIKPKMNLKIYGTVAPYLAGELYGKIEAELGANPWWSLYGGVNIGAGVKMEILGKEIFDYYTNPDIIEYKVLIVDANTVGGNQSPELPGNPSPPDNAFDQSTSVDISWECSDPDNDPLVYDIYFGASTPPGLVISNSSSTHYDPGTLNKNVTYYWKITAKDNHDSTTVGAEWQFTTADNNQAPGLPSNPDPADQSEDIILSPLLQWECIDPENDPLTYDIYLGPNNPPSIAETDYSSLSYTAESLSENTLYYWKIIAKDDQGNQTEGVIWTFTTGTGTFTDPRDGQTYNIVTIGSQTWFAENLNYETENSWCYKFITENCNVYGRLYTWDAALTACPNGWHLPSDNEWKTLEMYLGMSQNEVDNTGWRGTDEGKKLKSTSGWYNNGNGTDAVGFTALPGGKRYTGKEGFDRLGSEGYWWSATASGSSSAFDRFLKYDNDGVHRTGFFKVLGFSVRCLKD